MQFLVECDGVLLDMRARFLHAYHAVCTEFDVARGSPDTIWHAWRRGSKIVELARGLRSNRIRDFESAFGEALERDEAFAEVEAHDELRDALQTMRGVGECKLVAIGANREARRRLLIEQNISEHFLVQQALPDDPPARERKLATICEDDRQSVVVAASDRLIASADRKGIFCVGISTGACIADRLTRAGARRVYKSLPEFAGTLSGGARELLNAGLMPGKPTY